MNGYKTPSKLSKYVNEDSCCEGFICFRVGQCVCIRIVRWINCELAVEMEYPVMARTYPLRVIKTGSEAPLSANFVLFGYLYPTLLHLHST